MLHRRHMNFLLLLPVLLPFSTTRGEQPTGTIDTIGGLIAESMALDKAHRIAVSDFVSLDGSQSDLGRLIAEEVTTALLSNGYQVIERRLLSKVLEEHKEVSDLGGLLGDPANAALVGRLVGAQLLMVGTYADMLDTIRLNVRVVRVDTATIVGATALTIGQTDALRRLLVASTIGPESTGGAGDRQAPSSDESGTFFYEDFSGVPEGQVPAGWKGVENLCVRRDANGVSYLGPFQAGGNLITIPKIRFPEKYRIELIASRGGKEGVSLLLQLGGVVMGIQKGGSSKYNAIVSQSTKTSVEVPKNEKFTLAAEKAEGIYKLYLNETLLLVSRLTINLVPSMGKLLVDFSGHPHREYVQIDARIYSIKGVDLGRVDSP